MDDRTIRENMGRTYDPRNFDPMKTIDENVHGASYYQELPDGTVKLGGFSSPKQSDFNTEEMVGSMQKILAENIGNFVVVEFLIGTQAETRRQGILYHVGRSYLTLFDDTRKIFIVCDIFSVKFVYFFFPGERPIRNENNIAQTTGELSAQRSRSGGTQGKGSR